MFIIQEIWFVYVKILVGGACCVHVYDKQCMLRPPSPTPQVQEVVYSCIGGWPGGVLHLFICQ